MVVFYSDPVFSIVDCIKSMINSPSVRVESFDCLLGQALRTGQGRDALGPLAAAGLSSVFSTTKGIFKPLLFKGGVGVVSLGQALSLRFPFISVGTFR